MRPYRAAAFALGCVAGSASFSQDYGFDKAPCNGTFSLRQDSKIVELLATHGAAEEVLAIERGRIYGLENFKEFAEHHPMGVAQRVGTSAVRVRPISVIYFDADPKGHSRNDALYITVQVFESAEFSWTYRQCERAASLDDKTESLQHAIESAVVAGLESRLNAIKEPSVLPEEAERVALAIRK